MIVMDVRAMERTAGYRTDAWRQVGGKSIEILYLEVETVGTRVR